MKSRTHHSNKRQTRILIQKGRGQAIVVARKKASCQKDTNKVWRRMVVNDEIMKKMPSASETFVEQGSVDSLKQRLKVFLVSGR